MDDDGDYHNDEDVDDDKKLCLRYLTRKVEQMRRLFVSFGTDLEPLTNCCRWRRFVTLIVTITIVVVIIKVLAQ